VGNAPVGPQQQEHDNRVEQLGAKTKLPNRHKGETKMATPALGEAQQAHWQGSTYFAGRFRFKTLRVSPTSHLQVTSSALSPKAIERTLAAFFTMWVVPPQAGTNRQQCIGTHVLLGEVIAPIGLR